MRFWLLHTALMPANAARMPVVAQPFDRLEFDVDGHDCSWWSLDQMLADPRMRVVNGDLLGTLELIET